MAPQTNIATSSTAQGAATRALDRAKQFWISRDRSQRIYLGIGGALTLGLVTLLTSMILTPSRKPLIGRLDPADAQTISAQLQAKKIPYQLSQDGTSISVPEDQLDAARLEIASHDATRSGRMGFELFDKVSWGQTEFDERVNYQRALEGELERTIQTMHNVQSARVHLVMATDSVFLDRQRGAKASVALRMKRGSPSREQIAAIQRLVAGAVDELKPTEVAIIDADSSQSLSPQGGSSSDDIEQSLTRRLIATLSPVVGADRLRASVNVEYENGSSEESQERYDPAITVPLAVQRTEESQAGGAVAGGIPGTSSNVAAPRATNNNNTAGTTTSPAAVREPSQSSKSETANYGVNKTIRRTIEPAGRIKRLTAAVLLDDVPDRHQERGAWVTSYRKRSPEDIKRIAELAQASVGYSQQRGDVVSVENIGFERVPLDDGAPLKFADRTRQAAKDYASLIRYAVLFVLFGLVYLLLVRPVQKRALGSADVAQVALPHSSTVHELSTPIVEAPEVIAERTLLLKKQLSDFVKTEPESSAVAVRAWLREGTQ